MENSEGDPLMHNTVDFIVGEVMKELDAIRSADAAGAVGVVVPFVMWTRASREYNDKYGHLYR